MEIILTPIKQIFYNPENDYRILSCVPDNWNTDMKLNKYGNFTISGNNLSGIKIGQSVSLDITLDTSSNYEASYIVNGYSGITYEEEIKVDPNHELILLEQIMTKDQAKNINIAYPNFIELVLNNKENEIDIKKIYNVGDFRFTDYCNKIKENFGVFLFFSKTKTYNITDFSIVSKFYFAYKNPEFWEEEYKKNPYFVLSQYTEWSFDKIDKTILSALPDFKKSEERAKYCIYHYLEENETEGDTKLDARILIEVINEEYPELNHIIIPIIKNDSKIHFETENKYCGFEETYKEELNIANNIINRINNPIVFNMDWKNFKSVEGFEMTEEQNKICQIANNQSIGMMIGSAGTGKTSATKALIKMLEHYGKTYILLAPTGIAAKRLRESTGREASTIHMALAKEDLIDNIYNYVIIDEMSCVGVHLLSTIFDLIPKETKIIFICDNAQLASIACGNIVEDIINSNLIPTTTLTQIFRYGSSGIATIATNTRNGIDEGRELKFKDNDYNYIEMNNSPLNQIVEEYKILLSEGYSKNDILILCPYNKSSLGTYTINEAIQNNFNPNTNEIIIPTKGKSIKQICFKVGDRVINTKNNYTATVADIDENNEYIPSTLTCPIMNGDLGIICSIKKDTQNNTFEMYVQFDEEVIVYNNKNINNLLLGYCISCHKSQGSQAKAIISVIGKNHSNLVTRNLLYVAVSRAQERLIEIGNKDCISKGLTKVETIERSTWLGDILNQKGSCLMPNN